jgi:hypothetical protein
MSDLFSTASSPMIDPRIACEHLRDSYELYALGSLDREEWAEIDAHLVRGCEACRKGVSAALSLNAAVMSFTPAEHTPAALKHRVLVGVGYERVGWFWAGALAAVLMLIVALWIGVQERERTNQLADARRTLMDVTGERDRLTQALQFLSDPETKPASFGRGQQTLPRGYVFLHPEMGVMLIASNLPRAGQGKTYEMWVVPKGGGTPRPAGLFQSTGTRGLHILAGPVDIAMLGVVTVTVEPEAGSPAPTSTPIISAAVGS